MFIHHILGENKVTDFPKNILIFYATGYYVNVT